MKSWGGTKGKAYPLIFLELDGEGGQCHAPADLRLGNRERSGTHSTG